MLNFLFDSFLFAVAVVLVGGGTAVGIFSVLFGFALAVNGFSFVGFFSIPLGIGVALLGVTVAVVLWRGALTIGDKYGH